MGQAQLLLIVLGVVLVGIAIIAGIQAYSTNNQKASLDAMTHDVIRVFSDMQLYAQKPQQFGGPTVYGNAGLAEATFTTIGYQDATSATEWTNVNGTYTLASSATPTITATNADLGTTVSGRLCGINDEDIFVAVGTTAPACPAAGS